MRTTSQSSMTHFKFTYPPLYSGCRDFRQISFGKFNFNIIDSTSINSQELMLDTDIQINTNN
ncbi:hypothetical protein BpHYR1_014650 [Brachionus plicatilis]|uniref:Uncharacterized protein n=1 Tax=Brachionus plicatilis TaxID=10195 RepID=A0A3M7QKR8_BRAPC|nr:hypothetical protein BpHYR1_014650 [Brachionus plicatilis]